MPSLKDMFPNTLPLISWYANSKWKSTLLFLRIDAISQAINSRFAKFIKSSWDLGEIFLFVSLIESSTFIPNKSTLAYALFKA